MQFIQVHQWHGRVCFTTLTASVQSLWVISAIHPSTSTAGCAYTQIAFVQSLWVISAVHASPGMQVQQWPAGCVILISACDSTCIYIDDTCDSTVIFRTFWLPIYISCFDSLSHYKVECQREHIYLTQHYIIAIFVFGTIWKCHRNNQTDKSRGM